MRRIAVVIAVVGVAGLATGGPIGAPPAGAIVRSDGVMICQQAQVTKRFSPPLTSKPTNVNVTVSGTASGCAVAFAVGDAGLINNVVFTGKARIRQAVNANFDDLRGSALKLKLSFRNGSTPICSSPARVAFNGYAPAWDPNHVLGGLQEPKHSSRASGGQVLRRRCFDQRNLTLSFVHDLRTLDLFLRVNVISSVNSLTYTGATPAANHVSNPPIAPRFGVLIVD